MKNKWHNCWWCDRSLAGLALLETDLGKMKILCCRCGASGPSAISMRAAARKWNKGPSVKREGGSSVDKEQNK